MADMGSHIFDVGRFLFGEATRVCAQTHRVTPGIAGEDAATVIMRMQSGATVVCCLSYASRVEHDCFPQTFVHVEGEAGAVELAPDYWLRITTPRGTVRRQSKPKAQWGRIYSLNKPIYRDELDRMHFVELLQPWTNTVATTLAFEVRASLRRLLQWRG